MAGKNLTYKFSYIQARKNYLKIKSYQENLVAPDVLSADILWNPANQH